MDPNRRLRYIIQHTETKQRRLVIEKENIGRYSCGCNCAGAGTKTTNLLKPPGTTVIRNSVSALRVPLTEINPSYSKLNTAKYQYADKTKVLKPALSKIYQMSFAPDACSTISKKRAFLTPLPLANTFAELGRRSLSSNLNEYLNSTRRVYEEDSDVYTTALNVNPSFTSGRNNTADSTLTSTENTVYYSPAYENSSNAQNQSKEYSVQSSIVRDGIPSLRKKTLERQINTPSKIRGVVNLDCYENKVPSRILYTDYIIDIIKNIIIKQNEYVSTTQIMTKIDVDRFHRKVVVNWLSKLHHYKGCEESVFFITVRMFDKYLCFAKIRSDCLQLAVLVCFWIACKNAGFNCPTSSTLLKLCCNAYTLKSLLKLEQHVLQTLKFNICVEEPMIFVRYYIYLMQLENSNISSLCSNYLLECLSLDRECNTILLSLQAAAALYISLVYLNVDVACWKKLERYPAYHNPEELFMIEYKILSILRSMREPDNPYLEIYFKYSSAKNSYVSTKIDYSLDRLNKIIT